MLRSAGSEHDDEPGFVTLTTVAGVDLTLECIAWVRRSDGRITRGHLLDSPAAKKTLCGLRFPVLALTGDPPAALCSRCKRRACA